MLCPRLPYSLKELNLNRKFTSHSIDYSLSNTLPRERDAFGLEQGGRLMLLSAEKLPQLVLDLTATFP
jgi:protein BCP1